MVPSQEVAKRLVEADPGAHVQLAHADAAKYWPAAHPCGCADPPAHTNPAGQVRHAQLASVAKPAAPLYLPATQPQDEGWAVAPPQNEPGAHVAHAPPAQSEGTAADRAEEYVPGAQLQGASCAANPPQ